MPRRTGPPAGHGRRLLLRRRPAPATLLENDRKARVSMGNGKRYNPNDLLSESDIKVVTREAGDLWNALKETLTKNRQPVLDAQSLTDVTGQEFKRIGRNSGPVPSCMRS